MVSWTALSDRQQSVWVQIPFQPCEGRLGLFDLWTFRLR